MKSSPGYYPKPPSPCLCLNIRRASRAVTDFYENVLEPSGIKVTQFSLLRHLEMVEPATISKLAETMRIDRTTLNRNMKPLLEAGLIAVNTGQDPRSRLVTLTKAGQLALKHAAELWEQAQASLQEYLGVNDIKHFNHLIAKLEALMP
ncbi:MarR family winged helix-turn-helix transcriptional regulator [Sporomusa aerivorans]|uniref:MarR family winged helix-turn-helix transcriptional regulator n=1 Tax=Sporomusa aerivorans TaxID=204936 RepID=UPI003529FA88